MWILIYNKETLEVRSLISLFGGQLGVLSYLTGIWRIKLSKPVEYTHIKLETTQELEQVVNGSNGVKIKELPVLIKVDKSNNVRGTHYMKEIFKDDEFAIAVEMDAFNKQ